MVDSSQSNNSQLEGNEREKMEKAAKQIFGKRFVRFGPNGYDPKLGYAAIDGSMVSTDFLGLKRLGYMVGVVEATAKRCLIVHLQPDFEQQRRTS